MSPRCLALTRPVSTGIWNRTLAALLLTIVLTIIPVGCGDGSGLERSHISGTATFQAKPIPAGRIVFEPDAKKGNAGPQGFAKIVNGRYDTRDQGKGHIGGPHIVKIAGGDGVVVDELQPLGTPLFPDYSGSYELPDSETSLDFNIDSEAKKVKR